MVCPPGDLTSTGVDKGSSIDLVTLLYIEEKVVEGDFS
jgi:hypothetical protein